MTRTYTGFSVVRRATKEDYDRLNKSAENFLKRHEKVLNIALDKSPDEEAFYYLEYAIEEVDNSFGERNELRKNWNACARRALREKWAIGIAHDCVGFWV